MGDLKKELNEVELSSLFGVISFRLERGIVAVMDMFAPDCEGTLLALVVAQMNPPQRTCEGTTQLMLGVLTYQRFR